MRWAGNVACRERLDVYFGGETDNLEESGIDGRIILGWILGKWDEGQGLDFFLAQDRDRWRALVNALLNLRIP